MAKQNKLTKKRKIDVLTAALKMIVSEDETFICIAIKEVDINLYRGIWNPDETLGQFGIERPHNTYGNLSWWPGTEQGRETRIRVIKSAIRKLKAK